MEKPDPNIFKEIVDNVPGFVYQIRFRKDGSRYWSYISPEGEKLLGLTENFLGKSNLAEGDTSEKRADLLKSIENSVNTLKKWDYEYKYTRSNGEDIWLHCTGMPVKDGDEISMSGVLIDITERKETQQKLLESEEKFNSTFRNTPYPVYLTTIPDGVFLEVNNEFCNVSGYKREELINKSVHNFDFYLDVEQRDKLLATLERDKKLVDYRIQFRVKSGDLRDCSIYSEIIEIGGIPTLLTIVRDYTEQNKAVRALVSSETLYKSLFQNASDSIFLMNKEVFLNCNPRTLEIFGCETMSDIIGKGPLEFSPEFQPSGELSAKLAKKRLSSALEDKPQFFEWVHTRLDGEQFYAEVSLTRMTLDSEILILAIVRDITRRKQAENELLDLQEYLQLQIERMPIGLIIWNTKFEAISWNPSAENIFGYPEEVALGKHPYELIVPEDAKSVTDRILSRLLLGDETAHSINENLTADGKRIVCKWSNTPLRKGDGSVMGVLSMVQDITVQVRAEEELKTYQNYLEDIVRERTIDLEIANINLDEKEKIVRLLSEITSASNLSDDPEEAIFFAIERISDHTGWEFGHMVYVDTESGYIKPSGIWYAADKVQESEVKELLDKCSYESKDCPVRQAIARKKPLLVDLADTCGCELVNRLMVGQDLRSSFVFPIEIGNRVIGVIQFLFSQANTPAKNYLDIADQVSIQLGIAIQRKKTGDELLLEKSRAEDANKSKSQFLANMSHEIRTPMNSILGFTDILSNVLSGDKELDYLKSIRSSGDNLLKLINDILDLSKVEAGKLKLDLREVYLKSFLDDIIGLFSNRISEKGLFLKADMDRNLPKGILTDELRLRQIIINILSNAVKFTEVGGITLAVKSEKAGDNSINISFEVSDTGIGISDKFKDKLFDTFQQEDSGVSRSFEGAGLGLSITRSLVNLLDGEISVKSKQGEGSQFAVKIPNVTVCDILEEDDSLRSAAVDMIRFENRSVLLVEDNIEDQKYFGNILRDAGLSVKILNNGIEAMDLLRVETPEIVITDLKMPVMDGFDLFTKMKSDRLLKNIPVIAITASAMKEDIDRINASGFNSYLIKPVTMSNMYNCLTDYLPYRLTGPIEGKVRDIYELDISEELLTNLPVIINLLESDLMDDWQNLKKKQPLDKVKDFGSNIHAMGVENSIKVLEVYGESLLKSVDSFNVMAIKSDIDKYPDIIRLFKKLL